MSGALSYRRRMDLIAEDLMLLLLDDDSGRPLVDSTKLTHSLAGALLLELALSGSVVPEGPAEKSAKGTGKIVAAGPQPVDPLLALAWDACADTPRRAAAVVQKIDAKVKGPLLERIADKGWVQVERRKVLGLFPSRTFPETDGRHEAELRSALDAVLLREHTPDARTAALVSLLAAAEALPKLYPDLDRDGLKALKARATLVSEGEWAGAAVRRAISEVQTAVTMAVMVPVMVSSTGS